MQALKDNAPTLVVGLVVAILLVARNRGWLTADDVALVLSILAPLIAAAAHRMQPPGSGPKGPPSAGADTTTRIVAGLLVLLCSGCSASFEEARGSFRIGAPPPSQRCLDLDSQHRTSATMGTFLASLAGASGVASLPVREIDDETTKDRVQVGIAIGVAVAGSGAAAAAYYASDAAASYARDCAGAR